MKSPLLELRCVDFHYPGRSVLRGVDLQLHPHERMALTGPNGAGKSTLLQILVGLRGANAGVVVAFGDECRDEADFVAVRTRVGLLFQDSDDQLFCPTVLEDVAFGPLNLGRCPRDAAADAERTLAALGLENLADRVTHCLSAGEKRLVALATVLAMDPEVLLLDEPTTGLDQRTQERLVEHLERLPQAMVVVSHDMRVLERLATRFVNLEKGRLSEAVMHVHPHGHDKPHLHAAGLASDHVHAFTGEYARNDTCSGE